MYSPKPSMLRAVVNSCTYGDEVIKYQMKGNNATREKYKREIEFDVDSTDEKNQNFYTREYITPSKCYDNDLVKYTYSKNSHNKFIDECSIIDIDPCCEHERQHNRLSNKTTSRQGRCADNNQHYNINEQSPVGINRSRFESPNSTLDFCHANCSHIVSSQHDRLDNDEKRTALPDSIDEQSNNTHTTDSKPSRHQIPHQDNAISTIQATTIEVAPGEFVRLRGADETWNAIENDFYVPSLCICCEIVLFCIQDANFVLCPKCFVACPIDGIAHEGYDGGVGLGFTMEELGEWQNEISSKREH